VAQKSAERLLQDRCSEAATRKLMWPLSARVREARDKRAQQLKVEGRIRRSS
jgi:hypothetical protein